MTLDMVSKYVNMTEYDMIQWYGFQIYDRI